MISTIILGFVLVYPLWRIFSRTGLTPALSLLIFVPFVGGLIVLAVLAFTSWPATEGAAGAPEGDAGRT
ncbi:MAG: hypothetical protein ACE5KL_02825 [Alphaproteobacteria bacterium]